MKFKYKLFYFIILIEIITAITYNKSISQTYVKDSDRFLSLGNSLVEIVFDKSANLGIYSIIDKITGIDFRLNKGQQTFHSKCRLFAIDFWDNSHNKSYADNFFASSWSYSVDTLSSGLKLNFEHVGLHNSEIDVKSSITLEGFSSRINFNINIDNNQSNTIQSIWYPIISGITKIGNSSEDDYLLFPDEDGVLFTNPINSISNLTGRSIWMEYPAKRILVQFLSFYDLNCGLYIATEDQEGYFKRFIVENWDNDTDFSIMPVHLFEETPGNNPIVRYNTVLEVFHGDWYTAADLYKKWALSQEWCDQKIVDRAPDWFKELPAFMDISNYDQTTNTQRNTLPEIGISSLEYQKILRQKITTGVYVFDQDGPWVVPYSFPPRDGDTDLLKMVDILHSNNTKLLLPVGSSFYDSRARGYSTFADEYGVRREDGSLDSHIDNQIYTEYTVTLMCFFVKEWRDILLNEVNEAAKRGTDVIDIDKFPIPSGCYNISHGHSVGHGKWPNESIKELLENALTSIKSYNPESLLFSEWGHELYIPYISSYWSRSCIAEDYHYEWIFKDNHNIKCQPIPLFNYIYHPYIQPRGPEVLFLKNWEPRKQYRYLAHARNLIYGNIPAFNALGVENGKEIPMTDLADFKRILHAYADYGHHFLFGTEMLHPPQIEVPTIHITSDWNKYDVTTPAVLSSAWKSLNNSLGYLFVNVSDQTINFNLSISNYGLPLTYAQVYSVKNGEYAIIDKKASLPFNYLVEISPKDVLLIAANEALSDSIDLSISSENIAIDPPNFKPGQLVEVIATINNNSHSAAHPITVRFYKGNPNDNGVLIGQEKTIPFIEANDHQSAKLIYSIEKPEDMDIYVVVDEENIISEYDENNNLAKISFAENRNPPQINSTIPASDTSIVETDTLSFFVNAKDQDNYMLFYNWFVNGKLDSFSLDSTFTLITNYHSSGIDTIMVEVTDGKFSINHTWYISIENKPTYRILFDETHGELHSLSLERAKTLTYQSLDFTHWNYFEKWAQFNYEIENLLDGQLNQAILDSFNVVIMATPTSPLSQNEKTSLNYFVNNGGALLILSDIFAPPLNEFTSNFGILYDGHTLVDSNTNQGLKTVLTTFDTTHSISKDIYRYFFDWGNSLSVSDEAVPLAWTNNNVYQDKNGNFNKDPNEPTGSFVYLASSEYGAGRIVCMSDNSFWNWAWKYQENSKLMSSILKWLAEKQLPTSVNSDNDLKNNLPESFYLSQNFPNPFNSETTIKYQLPIDSKVKITVYNIIGQPIKILLNGYKKSGYYEISWDGKNSDGNNVGSGLYLMKFKTLQYEKSIKLLLLK